MFFAGCNLRLSRLASWPSMEGVLSSRFAGAKVCGGSLRAHPRRRRRRSICPISAGTRLGCAPSAAYPLSPRRREIVPLPPLHRAGADVNVMRSTIYSGSSAGHERRQEKGMRRMPPLTLPTIHDGVVVVARIGVILSKSSRPPALRLDKTVVHTRSSQRLFHPPLTLLWPGPQGASLAAGHRCRGDSADPFAIRRPSPSAAGGPRRQSPASNPDAS